MDRGDRRAADPDAGWSQTRVPGAGRMATLISTGTARLRGDERTMGYGL